MMEWLSSAVVLWFILASVLIIIEISVMTIALFFFALGALAAAATAWAGLGITWQLLAFIVVSIVSLVCLRHRLKAWLNRSDRQVSDNDLINKAVKVISPISAEQAGTVELNGAQWRAELEAGSPPLEAGATAVVTGFESLTLIVRAKLT